MYNNRFQIYNVALLLKWTDKLHVYTRNNEISRTQIKLNKKKEKERKKKGGKNASGDDVDLTIKNVILFFLKRHTNHLYIYIKENAYIHWISVSSASEKESVNCPCSPFSR